MKRRTSLIIASCATVGGTLIPAAQAAFATPNIRQNAGTESNVANGRSGEPTTVPASVQKVTVRAGDSLSTIGARTRRTWPQLAAYNHLADPDQIEPGQVLTVPPAGYVPAIESFGAGRPSASMDRTFQTYSYGGSGIWACIASHESGGSSSTNTGNGYYGMYQDTQQSWAQGGGLAYAPRADLASPAAQTAVNQRIQAQQGWGAWPVTSSLCGA